MSMNLTSNDVLLLLQELQNSKDPLTQEKLIQERLNKSTDSYLHDLQLALQELTILNELKVMKQL